MNEHQALTEAQKIADRNSITMVVTFNPFEEYETDRWGYCPEEQSKVCKYDSIKHTIKPNRGE